MKFIEGTGEQYAIDENGNVFSFRNGKTRKLSPGINNKGYYSVRLYYPNDDKYKHMRIHKLIAAAFLPDYNESLCVDHKDRNPLNNNIENLRVATQSQNMQNRSKRSNTSSKFKGVWYDEKRNNWQSYISYDNKRIHLGRYENEIDAARAYNEVANNLFGEFAKLNDIN